MEKFLFLLRFISLTDVQGRKSDKFSHPIARIKRESPGEGAFFIHSGFTFYPNNTTSLTANGKYRFRF